jgi:hypothetical protein
MGVLSWGINYFPKVSLPMSNSFQGILQLGVDLPNQMVKETFGAGDLFAARVFAGVYECRAIEE